MESLSLKWEDIRCPIAKWRGGSNNIRTTICLRIPRNKYSNHYCPYKENVFHYLLGSEANSRAQAVLRWQGVPHHSNHSLSDPLLWIILVAHAGDLVPSIQGGAPLL